MSNQFKGEKTITINHVDYPMIVNMNVIKEFETETGHDFMHCAIKALNAYMKASGELTAMDRATVMTSVVSLHDATWLFYLAAKEGNRLVEFGEIQEQLLLEGALEMDNIAGYPQLFTALIEFAIIGDLETTEKKPEAQGNGESTLTVTPG